MNDTSSCSCTTIPTTQTTESSTIIPTTQATESTTEILQSTTESIKKGGKILVYTGYGYNGTKAEVIDLLNQDVECDLYATLPVESYYTLGGKVNNEFLFEEASQCYIVGQDTPTSYEKCSPFKAHQNNITNAMNAIQILGPCQVQVDGLIYLMGGFDVWMGYFSNRSFIYSTVNGSIQNLPDMNDYHSENSCTSFTNGSHTFIVTVGGEGGYSTTEIMIIGEYIWHLGELAFTFFHLLINNQK